MFKRSFIITCILLVAFAGVCLAAVYHDQSFAPPSDYTQGWTDLWVYDATFPGSAPANYVNRVKAESNTMVYGQEAWGVYLNVYAKHGSSYTHIGIESHDLGQKPAYLPILTKTVNKPVNFFYSGPASYQDWHFHADSTHYSAYSHLNPNIQYDVIYSGAAVTVRLHRYTGARFGELDEGIYMIIDEQPIKLPEYDSAELSRELCQRVQLNDNASVVYVDQLAAIISGETHIEGWNTDAIKHILREIQAFEAAELSPGDSMPIYWFDSEGESVAIGLKKLDGSLKTALISLGR